MRFQNRISDYPDRRRIKIISQSSAEIVADIERADSNVTAEGTPLTAEILNAWDTVVTTAVSGIADAKAYASEAKTYTQGISKAANDASFALSNVLSPVSGRAGSLQQAINDIYYNLLLGITAGGYDNLGLTAAAYDGKNITALKFDTLSKLLLGQ